MTSIKLRLLLSFGLFLSISSASSRARASGYEIYEESPAGTAMAGALTGVPGDASAVFYNPAGLALQMGGPWGGSALVGATLATGATSVTAPDGSVTDANGQVFAFPTAFGAQHIGRRLVAGVGVYTQFGLGTSWPDDTTRPGGAPFPGRFIATFVELQSLTVNPTLSFAITDRISIGAGVDVFLASAELRRAVSFGDVEGAAHLGGTAQGVGANVGLLAWVVPRRFSFGMAYRSGLDMDFDMRAHFTVPPELASAVRDQPARLSLPFPHNLSLGVGVMPVDRLTITADVNVTLWSDFHTLTASFPTTSTPSLVAARDWRDTVTVRMGLEYLAYRGLALRFGWGYDQTPVPASTLDPTLPVSDRWLVSGGLGYVLQSGPARGLGLGAGYLAAISPSRTSTLADFAGTYAQVAHVVSLAATYRWGVGGEACAKMGCNCGASSGSVAESRPIAE